MRAAAILSMKLLMFATACNAESRELKAFAANTGDSEIDEFVHFVSVRNADEVSSRIDKFESISAVAPQYSNAAEYLKWTEQCSIENVKTVEIGAPSPNSPPDHFYWIEWSCANGKFRQAIATHSSPKVMVGEMIAQNLPIKVRKP